MTAKEKSTDNSEEITITADKINLPKSEIDRLILKAELERENAQRLSFRAAHLD